MHDYKTLLRRAGAVLFWLAVWQAAAMAIGQEVFLVSPVQALRCLLRLLPQADFWHRVGFSAGRILLGFGLGVVCSAALAVAAEICPAAEILIAPVLQLVKATPVASFIILALVWVRGSSLSVLISFLMVLPVLYGAVRTGIRAADPQLLEMAKVFRLPLGRRLRAVWTRRCSRLSGRGAAWRWASAGKAAWRRRSSACPTAASAMPFTGPRSPFPPGSCSPGPLSSSCSARPLKSCSSGRWML